MARSSGFALPTLPNLRETAVFSRKICYYDIGRGSPVVLVHGVGGDADQWAFCLDTLAASRRVIALDLLGFGRSDKPLIDYRIAGFVEMLERFLDNLGIARAHLLGHSLGGWIVAAFALQFPERVDRLVLTDAAGIDEGACEMPVDLRISTRASMRRAFEGMFHDKSMLTEELVLPRFRLRPCCSGANTMPLRRFQWRTPSTEVSPDRGCKSSTIAAISRPSNGQRNSPRP